jgi:chemotaxis methyl-accepting protein methylase
MKDEKGDNPRILSFGCSNGEEILSLWQKYFLRADIIGVDVNDEVIPQAQRNVNCSIMLLLKVNRKHNSFRGSLRYYFCYECFMQVARIKKSKRYKSDL